jgi:hypothetical protein
VAASPPPPPAEDEAPTAEEVPAVEAADPVLEAPAEDQAEALEMPVAAATTEEVQEPAAPMTEAAIVSDDGPPPSEDATLSVKVTGLLDLHGDLAAAAAVPRPRSPRSPGRLSPMPPRSPSAALSPASPRNLLQPRPVEVRFPLGEVPGSAQVPFTAEIPSIRHVIPDERPEMQPIKHLLRRDRQPLAGLLSRTGDRSGRGAAAAAAADQPALSESIRRSNQRIHQKHGLDLRDQLFVSRPKINLPGPTSPLRKRAGENPLLRLSAQEMKQMYVISGEMQAQLRLDKGGDSPNTVGGIGSIAGW